MTPFQLWAQRWNIPPQALAELGDVHHALAQPTVTADAQTEAGVMQRTQLAWSKAGCLLMRNNSGACTDQTGRLIRYGLGNTSKAVNDKVKSSDLIGIRPVLIEPRHVGATIGQFAAVECKKPGWKLTPGDKRAQAQNRFLKLVIAKGGHGEFAA